MSLLSLVESVTDRLALPRLSTVVGNTNDQARLILALANEEGRELGARGSWEALTKEQTFSTLAAESQGAFASLITDGDCHHILNDVMWNRTANQPIKGSVSPQLWQQMKSGSVSGIYPRYRIRGGILRMLPVPTAAQTVAFEYISTKWVSDSGGSTFYAAWNADTNVGLLSESIMADGVLWRFKRQKGFDYAEEFAAYERLVADALARDGGKELLNFNGGGDPSAPTYPEGSWSL